MLPSEHLIKVGKDYPGAWQQVEMFRNSRGVDLPDWPKWCFLPMAAWLAIVTEGRDVSLLDLHLVKDMSRLSAIGTWRYSQGIYRYDADFYQAIRETVPTGDLPSEVLYRLPEWCVYIETPDISWKDLLLHGFWCHLEWDVEKKRPELRFLLNTDQDVIAIPIHIGRWTLTEAVDRAVQEANLQAQRVGLDLEVGANAIESLAASLYELVSLVLYLCSDEPEIDDDRQPGLSPGYPQPKKVKSGWRLFPAEKPKIWTVGKHIGEQLRKSEEPVERGPNKNVTRPHLRRAHWHGYWTGPRDGERLFKYHWLPPVLVAGRD